MKPKLHPLTISLLTALVLLVSACGGLVTTAAPPVRASPGDPLVTNNYAQPRVTLDRDPAPSRTRFCGHLP